jgi:hypothetical protein
MNILCDTQEQQPWEFTVADWNIEHIKLKTGDYTIKGFENKLCIERKASVAEFAHNITEDRFWREVERMKEFPHRVIVCEFDCRHIDSYPENSAIPQRLKTKVHIRAPFIFKKISELIVYHNVPVLLCSNRTYAVQAATSLIKRVYGHYSTES